MTQALQVRQVRGSVSAADAGTRSLQARVPAARRATYCRWARVERYYTNALGMKLFSYFQKSKSRTRWGEVYAPFWEFKGHIGSSTSGGVGSWSYRAWTQGSFALCAPYVLCAQYKYPWIDMTVYANGGWTWSSGG